MKKQLEQLSEFQTSYNSTMNTEPTLISEDDYSLRYRLGKEELIEYFDACKDGNLTEIADALADQLTFYWVLLYLTECRRLLNQFSMRFIGRI